MVAFCVVDAPANRVIVQLVDSKIRNSGCGKSSFDKRIVSSLLRQTNGLLFFASVQLLIRINTIDAAIELAFLYSPVYKDAFEIYMLDLTGRIMGGDAAYDAMHRALLSALGKKTSTEESE
jgi:hypothetical protein